MTSPIRKIYFGIADRHQMFRLFDRHAQRPRVEPGGTVKGDQGDTVVANFVKNVSVLHLLEIFQCASPGKVTPGRGSTLPSSGITVVS